MTLTEKVLARASGKARVQPGDNVWVNVDVLMTHDVCGPGTIGVFKREFGKNAKVWDRKKVVIIPDHYIFTADSMSNRNVDILREFVKEQGLPYFYDVIDDPNGHWKFDAGAGPDQAAVRLALHRRLPHHAALEGPYAARRNPLRHRFAHLHGGRLQPVRHRDRQYRRGVHPRHRQAAHQGAGIDALFPGGRAARRSHGEGCDPARDRRHRLRRGDLPRHAVGRARASIR